MSAPAKPFGFNLVGHLGANMGLGVAARSVNGLLLGQGHPIAAFDIAAGFGRDRSETWLGDRLVERIEDLPYAINLFILGANTLHVFLKENASALTNQGFLNVGLCFWELPTVPPRWVEALETLDAIVAMSEFMRYAFQFSLSGPLTLSGRLPVVLPDDVAADRIRFDLPPETIVFIAGFEPHSDPERKNVGAVISAFLMVAVERPEALLVIKVNNPSSFDGSEHPVLSELRTRCAGHPRIRLMTDALTYVEVLSLYASCDVYVSLHRAEGLGLGLAEAMALGKPTIGTAWSGNLTFMDPTNSCLVTCALTSVEGTSRFYSLDQLEDSTVWAEPDIGEAAAWMRALVDDPSLRESIGRAAAESMRRFNRDAEEGHFVEQLKMLWSARDTWSVKRSTPRHGPERIATLRAGRLARIQHLERELGWIKSRPLYRLAAAAKRLLRGGSASRAEGGS